MARLTGRYRRGSRRRSGLPAIRISTGRRLAEDGDAGSRATDPLDDYQSIQPTDLVRNAAVSGGLSSSLRVPAEAEAAPEPSLQEYIDRIEVSAARLRAEHSSDAGTPTPLASTAGARTSVRPAPRVLRRRRPGQPRKKRTAAAPTKPWYRRRRVWLIVAVAIPLLIVTSAAAYVLNIVRVSVDAYGDIHEDPVDRTRWTVNTAGTPVPVPSAQVEAVLPDWENDDPINIVLLGVDAQIEEDQPPRSDTAIVVHVDPGSDSVAMMSIPRDLMVFIPGFGQDKFNAAYPIGEANEDEIPGGGPTLVAQTIEANFNIPIHYFATIDFDGFREVVDTVGGVVVDVEAQLSDNLYPTDDLRLTRVYFPSGLQKMDGEKALQYVRTRHGDSDFGRAERQQQVLTAIREQAISLDLITRAQSLIRDMQDTVRTDLDFNQMLALANLGRQIQSEDIARFNLIEEGLLTEHLPEFDGDAYYVEADWAAVQIETEAFFGQGEPAVDTADPGDEPDLSISVFVENATDIPQLAGSSAQLLVDAGFVEVWPSDARRLQSTSAIQVAPDEVATARLIAELLGVEESAIRTVTGSDGITVTLGDDVPDGLIPDPDAETAGE